jgi:ParB family chromosome partitioning protein
MGTVNQKIVLSASRDIPFNKLVLSQANVRRVKAGVSIEELAEDIARRTLLQSLTVRPVLDADGGETGRFEVPAGGRRFRALQLLVKQKRMSKTQPVPCVVREGGLAEEDSLSENVQRVALHPLDQFRAFQSLRDKGLSEEEIAARFFVTASVVKQRLRLAAVSNKLLEIYADDGMTLDQLMAFTVTNDHARQEQVWNALAPSYTKEPYVIRRQLTEGAVRASDKRAQFVGVGSYEAAGGLVMRDLFQADDGGWLQDPGLLDRLVTEKLETEAATVRAEGWKWVTVAPDFPYGHTAGKRRLTGRTVELTAEEQACRDTLEAEYVALERQCAEADEIPDTVDERLREIEAMIAALDERPVIYDPEEIARAGVFVSIDGNGVLRIDRAYMRAEDEAPVDLDSGVDGGSAGNPESDGSVASATATIGGAPAEPIADPDDDDRSKPLSDRLLTELTAHRTLALRDAVANDPGSAFVAVLYTLCLGAFYGVSSPSCLEISAKSTSFSAQAPGLSDSASARAIEARHDRWVKQLPAGEADLWDALSAFDRETQLSLFAHCASLSINAVHERWNCNSRRLAHAESLARAVSLDMAGAGWQPTIDNYLGRVSKARILEAVREAKGAPAAQSINHLKKSEMAIEAERLLEGTGWLPQPLRTQGLLPAVDESASDAEADAPSPFVDSEDAKAGGVDPGSSHPGTIAAE